MSECCVCAAGQDVGRRLSIDNSRENLTLFHHLISFVATDNGEYIAREPARMDDVTHF